MLTPYGAYLLRCWKRDGEIVRIEIVHVQSGERIVVRSAAEAVAWIDTRRRTNPPTEER